MTERPWTADLLKDFRQTERQNPLAATLTHFKGAEIGSKPFWNIVHRCETPESALIQQLPDGSVVVDTGGQLTVLNGTAAASLLSSRPNARTLELDGM